MAFRKPRGVRGTRSYPTLSRLILERIAEAGEAAISSFFPTRYPEARLWRTLLGLGGEYQFQRETFAALLSRLQRQGLVRRSGSRRQSIWHITKKGRDRLVEKNEGPTTQLDGVGRLVIFDIPEKERQKRDVVRMELIGIGFQQLQKSVWYGERPLPRDFVELIDTLSLRSNIHIFSVRESGTITKYKKV